jgi:hypothetical protein
MSILIQLCFLAFQAFVWVASPSSNSPLLSFKLRGDEGGVEKIKNFHLEEIGEKEEGFSTISRSQRKEGG